MWRPARHSQIVLLGQAQPPFGIKGGLGRPLRLDVQLILIIRIASPSCPKMSFRPLGPHHVDHLKITETVPPVVWLLGQRPTLPSLGRPRRWYGCITCITVAYAHWAVKWVPAWRCLDQTGVTRTALAGPPLSGPPYTVSGTRRVRRGLAAVAARSGRWRRVRRR